MGNECSVTITWYCGCYVGAPKWQSGLSDWIYEPDECGAVFETEESAEDWATGNCYAICPKCAAELGQAYDEPRLLS